MPRLVSISGKRLRKTTASKESLLLDTGGTLCCWKNGLKDLDLLKGAKGNADDLHIFI